MEKGHRKDEDVYLALGQTNAGRYLAVLFIYKRKKKKGIDLECQRYGKKGEKTVWQKNSSKRLPSTKTLRELAEFFDKHDMGEYWDQMPEADFEIDIKRREYLIAIDADLLQTN